MAGAAGKGASPALQAYTAVVPHEGVISRAPLLVHLQQSGTDATRRILRVRLCDRRFFRKENGQRPWPRWKAVTIVDPTMRARLSGNGLRLRVAALRRTSP